MSEIDIVERAWLFAKELCVLCTQPIRGHQGRTEYFGYMTPELEEAIKRITPEQSKAFKKKYENFLKGKSE